MKLSKVNEMRELDKNAIEKLSIKDEILMENAGEASYYTILKNIGIKGKKFIIFCGSGNNGGDGFVVARKLHSMGGIVKIFITGNPDNYKNASKINYEIIKNLNINMVQLESEQLSEKIKIELAHSDVIIDAIFGTGLSRNITGEINNIISLINNSGKTVVSLDIPSGINGNTGAVMGDAVNADFTVTFGLPKYGNILYPGFKHCGKLITTHISFPGNLYKHINTEINNPEELPKRNPDGHKGFFGDVLFISGASNYYGAPCFAALSFLKAGGGYSRLASPDVITPFISQAGREIVHIPLESTETGSISIKNIDKILKAADVTDMTILGPGLSLNIETLELARELVEVIDKPLIIDGDGITAISEKPEILIKRKQPAILTPHPGEMARVCKKSLKEVTENKIETARETAEKLNCFIVLKCAHTIIAFPDKRIFINLTGNSGMATAGSGDVLTGTIAAMAGLGLEIDEAVKTGVFIHGLSGDLAAEEKGEDGITAGDILEYLPETLKYYRNHYPELESGLYNKIEII